MLRAIRSFTRRLSLAADRRRHRSALAEVTTYCMFIGYPRSGHSLVGSLLDAHPNIVIAHEADALRMVEGGAALEEFLLALVKNSAEYAQAGRTETGYSYNVPGQWQGRFSRLQVVGDKKGGQTSLALLRSPQLLDRLQGLLGGIALRLIHVIRNPFDNSTTITTRGRTFAEAVDLYFSQCDSVANTKRRTESGTVFDLRHEDVIEDPRQSLEQLCRFLDVESPPDYVEACTGIVYRNPSRTRCKIEWTPEMITVVQQRMAQYDYLSGYTYDA